MNSSCQGGQRSVGRSRVLTRTCGQPNPSCVAPRHDRYLTRGGVCTVGRSQVAVGGRESLEGGGGEGARLHGGSTWGADGSAATEGGLPRECPTSRLPRRRYSWNGHSSCDAAWSFQGSRRGGSCSVLAVFQIPSLKRPWHSSSFLAGSRRAPLSLRPFSPSPILLPSRTFRSIDLGYSVLHVTDTRRYSLSLPVYYDQGSFSCASFPLPSSFVRRTLRLLRRVIFPNASFSVFWFVLFFSSCVLLSLSFDVV